MRLFVSVDLDGLADEVGRVQARFSDVPGLTLTDPEQAHVTLKFLGDQPDDGVPALSAALDRAIETAGVPPFEAHFTGLGAFPSEEYIRVVWLGVADGSAELTALHERVETALVDAGHEPAAHAFTPHVTLARMHHAGGKERVQAALAADPPDVGHLTVTEVRLTESRQTADGPVYETIDRFPLA